MNRVSIKEYIYNPSVVHISYLEVMSVQFFTEVMNEYNKSLLQHSSYSIIKGIMMLNTDHLNDLVIDTKAKLALDTNEFSKLDLIWADRRLQICKDLEIESSISINIFDHPVTYIKGNNGTFLRPDDNNYLIKRKRVGMLYTPDSELIANGDRRVELEL